MRNRYLVLGLSAFLAIALAVPALGGPGNPVSSGATALKDTASKALKKAKKANSRAKAAQSTADQALSDAGKAQNAANTAQTDATKAIADAAAAQTTANEAKTAAATAQAAADAAQATADTKFDTVNNVEGTTTATNNADKGITFATCPTGQRASGGGYIINGAGAVDAQPTFNTAYGNAWGVNGLDLGTSAGTWNLTPTVRCLST